MAKQERDATQLVADYFRAKHEAYASPITVNGWMDEGRADFFIVDVRNPSPLITTRIPGAKWLPEKEMAARIGELPKDKLLVLYCWDTWCSLATSAAVVLIDHGYSVKELWGGVKAWKTLRLPETVLDEKDILATSSH
jgi:rhodanese-related sulfurtransferase